LPTVSNHIVSRFSGLRRILRVLIVVVLLFLAIFAAFIPIQQRVLRRRAEHLLSDIREIQLRKSTWADAQKIFARWGAWGHSEGDCTERSCTYEIELTGFWFPEPYEMLGGRWARINASLSVADGVIWGKAFSVEVEVPPGKGTDHSYDEQRYALIGRSESAPRFWPNAMHPNYLIGKPSGCEGCMAVWVRFTPYADPADVQRLMDFDLSCLTRWPACREERDIMPAAWKEHTVEEGARIPDCDTPLAALGRDSENAAVVDVISSHTENRAGETVRVAKVRLVRRLKGARFWKQNRAKEITLEITLYDDIGGPSARNQLQNLPPSRRFILLFNSYNTKRPPDGVKVRSSDCGAIPLTDQNLTDIQLGINQDYQSTSQEE